MAALPADFSVSVADYTDSSEIRPSDERAIVFDVERDESIMTYMNALNVHINDKKSFVYGNRISSERILVVMSTAAQASHLVENIGEIKVNNKIIPLKFYVAKAIKVIISNAIYGISNSSIKKFLTKDCGIRAFSSVSELKTNMGSESDEWNLKSFRRVIYIHPDDVTKLPKKPIKFLTRTTAHFVFFETENQKCHLCHEVGHYRANCPRNELNSENNSPKHSTPEAESLQERTRTDTEASVLPSSSFQENSIDPKYNMRSSPCDNSALSLDNKFTVLQRNNKQLIEGKQENEKIATVLTDKSNQFKRPCSPTASDASSQSFMKCNVKSKNKNHKKRRVLDEVEFLERLGKIKVQLEPARAHIDASLGHFKIKFDRFSELLAKSCTADPKDRRSTALSYLNDSEVLLKIINQVYGIVQGKGIKQKLTSVKNAIEFIVDESSGSQTDASLASDGE